MKQISINKIFAHPDNPREELGDISEITESIRKKGIYQNLTVVPHDTYEDSYTVIIGHRRLQAAREAGLKTVPAIIIDIPKDEQQGIMLVENMQREDLTPYEQARGIQRCLDLGLTTDDIAEKTGFHKSTIRRRVKMLELDQDKVKKARNATLEEYAMLEEIEDLDKRNELLEHIGTDLFERNVRGELSRIEKDRVATELVEYMDSKGIVQKEKSYSKHEDVLNNYNLRQEFLDEVKKYDFSDGPYFYEHTFQFTIFKERPEEDNIPTAEEIEIKERRKEIKGKKAQVDKILEIERDIRVSLVKDLIHGEMKLTDKQRKKVRDLYIVYLLNREVSFRLDDEKVEEYELEKLLNIDDSRYWTEYTLKKSSEALLKRKFEEYLLLVLQMYLDESGEKVYNKRADQNLEYARNENLLAVVELLGACGCSTTNEYQELLDGTHELFDQVEDNES